MTLDLTHLSAAARLQAFESSDARVRMVQEARWISHERVQRVLDELEWRYLHPVCSHMPCLLLYGDSGIGKTMAIANNPLLMNSRRARCDRATHGASGTKTYTLA